MKKIILFFCLIIFFSTQLTKAQAPGWLWAEGSTGGSYEYPSGISADMNGNLFISGRFANSMELGGLSITGKGADNPFAGKFDTSGTAEWLSQNSYSGGYDYPWGFWRDNKDNIYDDGVLNSETNSFLDKYNSAGDTLWGIELNEKSHIVFNAVAADNSGNIYIAGYFQDTVILGTDTLGYPGSHEAIFLAKLDSNGNFIWARSAYGTGANDGYDVARGITIDKTGNNIYITGGYSGTPTFGSITAPASTGYSNLFIAQYDSSGNAVNVFTATSAGISSNDCCTVKGITIDDSDNLYVTGYFLDTAQFGNFTLMSEGQQNIYVAKCNDSGVWKWANGIVGSGDEFAYSLVLDKSNNVYVAGSYSSPVTLNSTTLTSGDMLVAKYSSSGVLQWAQSATINDGGAGGITVDTNNYVYVDGNFSNTATFGAQTINATSNADIFIAKLNSGSIATGIEQLSVNSNQLSVYPNPTGGEINITSTKPINTVTVTNLLGQTVLKSPSGDLGVTHFTFELKDEGMYFVTVTADGEITTSKIVVSR